MYSDHIEKRLRIAIDRQSEYQRLRRFTFRLMAVVAVETGIVAYLLWRAW